MEEEPDEEVTVFRRTDCEGAEAGGGGHLGPVGSLDADAPIQTEPATVIPAEHVFGVVGLQEAVATEVAEDPFPNGVLEALQELVGEGCGLVEAEVGFWIGRILIRIILGPLEEPIDHAQVVVEMRI